MLPLFCGDSSEITVRGARPIEPLYDVRQQVKLFLDVMGHVPVMVVVQYLLDRRKGPLAEFCFVIQFEMRHKSFWKLDSLSLADIGKGVI